MNWLIFALLAYFLWAVSNLTDKIVISKYIKKKTSLYLIFVGSIGLLPLIILFYEGIKIPSLLLLILCLLSGIFYILGLYPYYLLLKKEEITKVVPLWNFSPFFVLLLSFFFLDARITYYNLLAFLFLFGGSLLMYEYRFSKIKILFLMLISSIIFGIHYTLLKYIYLNMSFLDGFVLIRIGAFLGSLIFLIPKQNRTSLKKIVHLFKFKKISAYATLSESVNLFGIFFINLAIFYGPVYIINALGGIQSFFLLLLAILCSFKFSYVFKEERNRKVLIRKFLAISVIAIGLLFIYL